MDQRRRVGYKALLVRMETHFKKERNALILQYSGDAARIHVSDVLGFKEAIEKASAKEYAVPVTVKT